MVGFHVVDDDALPSGGVTVLPTDSNIKRISLGNAQLPHQTDKSAQQHFGTHMITAQTDNYLRLSLKGSRVFLGGFGIPEFISECDSKDLKNTL
jgi:hypothetical protein